MNWAISVYLDTLFTALWILGSLMVLNSVDELFVDICYLVARRTKRIAVSSKRNPEIHILVPAWDEQFVIGPMLHHCRQFLHAGEVHLWVGCYANDPLTEATARRAAENHDAIQVIRIPRHGPTTKADCLNLLWANLPELGSDAVILLHDAEDMPDPRAIIQMSAWMGDADMLQFPVLPLRKPGRLWTAGHYLDEFTEKHMNELPARLALGAPLPSAGVGCAFRVGALRALAATQDGLPFDPKALTEDYAVAMQLAHIGCQQRFAGQPLQQLSGVIGTRAMFPDMVGAAVRQKSRWLLGIVLQGLHHFGWGTSWRERYFFWRDRKGMLVSFTAIAGYVLAVAFIIAWIAPPLNGAQLNVHLAEREALVDLLTINAVFLIYRAAVRGLFVGRLYGWWEGAISIPRQFWANIINFLASARALRLYINHRRTKRPLVWDKTDHEFPPAQNGTSK